jgi:hypothetical protein
MAVVEGAPGKLGETFSDIFAEKTGEFAQSGRFGDEQIGTCAETGFPVGFHR